MKLWFGGSLIAASLLGDPWGPRNLGFEAVLGFLALTAGAGDLTLKFGAFTIGGIGTATFGAIILYQILTSPLARRAE